MHPIDWDTWEGVRASLIFGLGFVALVYRGFKWAADEMARRAGILPPLTVLEWAGWKTAVLLAYQAIAFGLYTSLLLDVFEANPVEGSKYDIAMALALGFAAAWAITPALVLLPPLNSAFTLRRRGPEERIGSAKRPSRLTTEKIRKRLIGGK